MPVWQVCFGNLFLTDWLHVVVMLVVISILANVNA